MIISTAHPSFSSNNIMCQYEIDAVYDGDDSCKEAFTFHPLILSPRLWIFFFVIHVCTADAKKESSWF